MYKLKRIWKETLVAYIGVVYGYLNWGNEENHDNCQNSRYSRLSNMSTASSLSAFIRFRHWRYRQNIPSKRENRTELTPRYGSTELQFSFDPDDRDSTFHRHDELGLHSFSVMMTICMAFHAFPCQTDRNPVISSPGNRTTDLQTSNDVINTTILHSWVM
jgi:hypothetical protein